MSLELGQRQIANIGQGSQLAYNTGFLNNCLDIAKLQVNAGITSRIMNRFAGMGGLQQTPASQTGVIVHQNIKRVFQSPAAAEGGPVALTEVEVQAFVSVKESFGEKFMVTSESLNREDSDDMEFQTSQTTLNAVRRLQHMWEQAMVSSYANPDKFHAYHGVRSRKKVAELVMSAFGCINKGTEETNRVVTRAVNLIHDMGGEAMRIVCTPDIYTAIQTSDLLAIHADIVGPNGVLQRTTPQLADTASFRGLALVKTTGVKGDPFRRPTVRIEHFTDSRVNCGDSSRSVQVPNRHNHDALEYIDRSNVIAASRMFDENGVRPVIKEMVDTYNATGSTPWHEKHAPSGVVPDPFAGKTFGSLTYRNSAGDLAVAEIIGNMDIGNPRAFTQSIMDTLGPGAYEISRAISKGKTLLKQIAASTPDELENLIPSITGEFAATFENETGAVTDALGNDRGVITFPSTGIRAAGATTGGVYNFCGYCSGPGIAHLADVEAANPGIPSLQRGFGAFYQAALVLGQAIASTVPESALFSPPGWHHGPFDEGMAVIQSFVGASVPIFRTGAAPTGDTAINVLAADLVVVYDTGTNVFNAEGITGLIETGLAADRVDSATAGLASLASLQDALIAVVRQDAAERDEALRLLNEVAAIAGAGDTLGAYATLDVRAVAVFKNRPNPNTSDAIHQLLAAQRIGVDSVMDPENIAASRQIVRRVAAAALQGNFPSGNYVDWFMASAPSNEAAKAALENVLPVALTTAADAVRMPLVVTGKSASLAPPGVIAYGTPNAPWVPFTPASAIPTTGNAALFNQNTIGAVFGAYGRATRKKQGAVVPQAAIVKLVGSKTLKKNSAAVEKLPDAHRAIGRFLLSTPVNASSMDILLNEEGDHPVTIIYHRFVYYDDSGSMLVTQGDAESSRVVFSPINTFTSRDDDGNLRGTMKVEATGINTRPGNHVFLPCALLGDIRASTGDCTMKDASGIGGFIPSFVSPNFRAPARMPLSGIDATTAEILNPAAPILDLVHNLEKYAPKSIVYGGKWVSYQGEQHSMDARGKDRHISGSGICA